MIFMIKSIRDFYFQTGSRLKPGFTNKISDGRKNRVPFFLQKSMSDFHFKNDQRFSF